MRYVTIEDLKRHNHSAAYPYLNDYELAQVNMLVERIEQERNTLERPRPLPGDLVTCFSTIKGKHGSVVTERARLTHGVSLSGDPVIEVTVHDASVHLTPESMYMAISGGPEYMYPIQDFTFQAEYLGRREATFWIWNFWGAGPHHGVHFTASVNAWKLVADHLFN